MKYKDSNLVIDAVQNEFEIWIDVNEHSHLNHRYKDPLDLRGVMTKNGMIKDNYVIVSGVLIH